MADYYPLIARAVAGLEKNTGENRRALYERARTALVEQLRGVVPALDESEITRERLSLEEAIRKIEAESARRARQEPRPPPPRPDARREEPRAAPPPEPPPPPPREPPRPVVREHPPAERPSLAEEAMRGYRDDGQREARRAERPAGAQRPAAAPPPAEPAHYPQHEFDQLEPQIRDENMWGGEAAEHRSPSQPMDFDAERPPGARARTARRVDQGDPDQPVRTRSYRGLIRTAVLLLLLGSLAALAWWQRDAITETANTVMALVRGPSAPAPRDTTPSRPKITDRIGQPGTQPSGAPAVAQRVVLYEEDPDDPQGKRLVGSAIWRTEVVPAAPGRAAELAVRADVEVPERRMTMTWSLRRNSDPALPASHTIEIMFNLPADAPSGGVQNVPGVLMKQAEQTRGVPLAGLAVKVTPGFFLIGLSALESDMQRNVQLLKERTWFDVPIVYNNNRRALLAMEKGTPGERAFTEAFAAWKQ